MWKLIKTGRNIWLWFEDHTPDFAYRNWGKSQVLAHTVNQDDSGSLFLSNGNLVITVKKCLFREVCTYIDLFVCYSHKRLYLIKTEDQLPMPNITCILSYFFLSSASWVRYFFVASPKFYIIIIIIIIIIIEFLTSQLQLGNMHLSLDM
jgi:hypothetical protein